MKYRKKPVVIEAQQFTDELKDRVYLWAQSIQMNVYHSVDDTGKPIIKIPTLEGEMTCSLGDWIIRGVKGELYPCKPDIFEKTYEPFTDATPAVFTAAALAKAREEGRREGILLQRSVILQAVTDGRIPSSVFSCLSDVDALLAEGKKEQIDE